MKKTTILFIIWSVCVALASAQQVEKRRVVVLTDIEADPDDTQSLVRLLLYANELDLRGIVATTSCWHKNEVNPESVHKVIDAYEKVQSNLKLHDQEFPSADYLRGLVCSGKQAYGMGAVGKGMDSEGSELLYKELLTNDDRPLYVSVWGGANVLAQTLYKLKETTTKKECKKAIAKLRVYTISDQDDSGIWIRNNFPEVFYIVSPGGDYAPATWIAISGVIDGIDNSSISNKWLMDNIQQGHGALGAIYPDVSWGVEGDTPAFLFLLNNGLNNPECPNWGGWGGRYELYKPEHKQKEIGQSGVPEDPETRPIWTDASDKYTPFVYSDYGRVYRKSDKSFEGNKVTLWRWRDDFQNDFAARMDWCTQSYENANHAPIIKANKEEFFTVNSGQHFGINALEITDPDGDSYSFIWFDYPEAGTYKKNVNIGQPENSHAVYVQAPKVDKEETIHIILKVTDKGTPNMCSYKRFVVTVTP